MRRIAMAGFFLAVAAAAAQALTTATTSGYWDAGGTWSAGVPGDGEVADIPAGITVTLTNETAALSAVTNAGRITFVSTNAVLSATNVQLTAAGRIDHNANTATSTSGAGLWVADNRVTIVCSNLAIGSTAGILVDGKGFAGSATGNGYGPGGGFFDGISGGGSYGGRGHVGTGGKNGGPTYGDPAAPLQPGSGAGKSNYGGAGGNGGGAVRIVASGHVAVDGTISANGTVGGKKYGSGGSGGGISIACRTFTSAGGTVRAQGANWCAGYNGSGGGGGRIAVVMSDPVAQASVTPAPTPSLNAAGGTSAAGYNRDGDSGAPGTVYLSNASFYPTPVLAGGARIIVPGMTSWAPDSLTINGAWIQFDAGFSLSVTNDVVINGSVARLDVDKAQAVCGGDWRLTNAASMQVFAAATNGGAPYGALVAATGAFSMAASCELRLFSSTTNGGSPAIAAGSVSLASGSLITADGAGFRGAVSATDGPNGAGKGYGPGASLKGGAAGGPGYGGIGGAGTGSAGGPTYGSESLPAAVGSGAAYSTYGSAGGAGGGLVRIDARGELRLAGTISANGGGSPGNWGTGGSGGAIRLSGRTLAGTNGLLRANGGNRGNYGSGRGGAGGRIAVWRVFDNYQGPLAMQVNGGIDLGNAGTTRLGQLPAPPLIVNRPASNIAYYSAELVGTLTSTGTADTAVWVFWGETDGGTNPAAWAHTNAFAGIGQADATYATNVTGLASGIPYVYRFYASNSVGDAWAPSTTNFSTVAGKPVVTNTAASSITLVSADLDGYLVSTGTAPTTVSVYWGTADGGTNAANWSHTNAFSGYTIVGALTTNVGLPASDVFYLYRYFAQNVGGSAWAEPATAFLCGQVGMLATDPAARENGAANTGLFTVDRPASATNLALTVNYAISGTASNGVDYEWLSGQVVIPAGATSATIPLVPIMDAVFDDAETVALTLSTGAYVVDPGRASDTVTIEDVVPSATNTWTGTGLWTTYSNWSDALPPIAGQHAVVDGNVTLAASPAALASLDVKTGRSLTFRGWTTCLTADVVTVSGTVTHEPNTDTAAPWTPDNRVWLECTNLTVVAGGAFSVDAKGYAGSSSGDGYGPGRSYASGNSPGGAAYGGAGGAGAAGARGVVYGSAASPTDPGSGAAYGSGGGSTGGDGGGAIRIVAHGSVSVEGTISADGETGQANYGPGGSGGAIFITCRTFRGAAGVVRANGGNRGGWGNVGGGGGGRIAIVYDPSSQDAVSPQPAAALSASGGAGYGTGYPGTVYLADTRFFPREDMATGCRVVIPGFTNWLPDHLTLDNVWVQFEEGFALAATNAVRLSGAAARLDVDAGSLACRTLALTNSARLYVYAAPTNAVGPDYGVLVTAGEGLSLGSGCVLYAVSDDTNGASPLFRVGALDVAAGALINADAAGFRGGLRGEIGYGPGAQPPNQMPAGAGHGGQGGPGTLPGGLTYGVSNAPVLPGSGGPGGTAGYHTHGDSGDGGGLVRIEAAGTVVVNGTISANGQGGLAPWGAGGSGGAIYIQCGAFAGSGGVLRANGGNRGSYGSGRGGGGGRIAVAHRRDLYVAPKPGTVNGGSDGGQPGTVVWIAIPPSGTVFILR